MKYLVVHPEIDQEARGWGDAVSALYTPQFPFTGGEIVKVVFDVAYIDVERHLAAAIARD